jgi:signal transduction histidine kinase
MRKQFFWRVALLFGLVSLLAIGFVDFLARMAVLRFGHEPPDFGPPDFGPPGFGPWGGRPNFLFFLLIVVGVVLAVRALRRVTAPVGNVIEAAGQVAGGNYTVRVSEEGPPEVRSLARAFNQMIARLQAHEDQRRNLLAEVTHELRTPLAVIQGNLEGLLDGVYPRDDAHLEPVLDEARVMSTLIEDLRTLALAETGALQLQRESTDLGPLTQDTVAAFRPQAEAAGIVITEEFPPDLPALEIDPTRIRQVLANLLTNALQHTPRGGSIRITCRAELGEASMVSVSIMDTGSGIPPAELPHIFDRFHKSKDSRGSGLGLAIARNLITLHGGEIGAESEPGRGTTVRFTLPVTPGPSA